ncbi:MAG TPA: hypothetical protein QF753_02390 [Victivallales bacterium]|nr:hypothetical protein [Victivallales bacterium]
MKIKFTFVIKNYEKLLLSAVLVIFILSLIWLVDVFYESENQRSTGITVISNKAPYRSIHKSYYDFENILKNSILWLKSKKRNINKSDRNYIVTHSDFMIPFHIARSNAHSAEGRLIPYAYYKLGKDPITKEKLFLPDEAVMRRTADVDKDGIPDIVEKQIGTNPTNKSDKDYDIDKDSFSNIQDYKHKYSGINNPSVHPPLIKRLILINIAKTKIPLILKKIIKKGTNKKDWDIQVNILINKRWKTKFLKINSSIDLNDLGYKITDIKNKLYDELDPRLGAIVQRDESEIVLLDSTGEKITAKINKPVYEPKRLITVKDLYTNKIYKIRINNSITLGNKTMGYESYKLVSINDVNNTLEFSRDNKIYTVRKTTSYIVPIKQ